MLRFAPARIAYELGSGLHFFFNGAGMAFLRSKVAALRAVPRVLRQGEDIQRHRDVSNDQLRSLLADGWVAAIVRKFLPGLKLVTFGEARGD